MYGIDKWKMNKSSAFLWIKEACELAGFSKYG